MTTPSSRSSGIENPAVMDAIIHDAETDSVVLVMYELRPWADVEQQLFQLQEKLNAYVSFALDGEMEEVYPQCAGKKIAIHLRTRQEPPDRVMEFAALVSEQLSFQNIAFTVILTEECGSEGCGCHENH